MESCSYKTPPYDSREHVLKTLDSMVDVAKMKKAIEQARRLLAFAATRWTEDIRGLSGCIEDWCPRGWTLYADTLLEKEGVVKSLLMNKKFGILGRGVELLMNMWKLACDITHDNLGPFIEVEVFDWARAQIEWGTLTWTATFALHHVLGVLPKVNNEEARKRDVDEPKKQTCSKRFPHKSLGKSLGDRIESLC